MSPLAPRLLRRLNAPRLDNESALMTISDSGKRCRQRKTRKFPDKMEIRRDGRVVDGGGLENH
jgi:hypothetical protein